MVAAATMFALAAPFGCGHQKGRPEVEGVRALREWIFRKERLSMSEKQRCQSCGMPIDGGGVYCRYCVDDEGKLQSFDVRFERMTQWMTQQEPGLSRQEAKSRVLAHMATMPAWRDHPRVKSTD
jgi:hypothetical protein